LKKRIEIFSSQFPFGFQRGHFLTSFWYFPQLNNAKSLFEMLASAIWEKKKKKKKKQPLIIAVEISFQNSTIESVELKCKSNEDFQNHEKNKMRLLIFIS
jgi:hypothetical protein